MFASSHAVNKPAADQAFATGLVVRSLNQRPKDGQRSIYSPPLYPQSYGRRSGVGTQPRPIRKTCGPFEEGSKEELAFPYRESNPGRLGENQES
ncbi:hypothetical protein ROHU_009426 [Labeo rohita]|uniref:Uncharacterized protein n=1 Tax=Labeo rohita TaxID=84645 RepID=A0A498LZT0_LABRO|nr:hypothetical protein ROHU_009426 [Labeo rohita]